MKLLRQKIISSLLVVASGVLLFFLFKRQIDTVKICFSVVTFFIVLSYYNNSSKNERTAFLTFLIFQLLAEVISITRIIPDFVLLYTVINISYILSYSALAYFSLKDVGFNVLWTRFKGFVIILGLCTLPILYFMNSILYQDPSEEVLIYPLIMENLYNLSIIVALCSSFLGYLYHDSKKYLVLFLISLCFVFSEVPQLAYIYLDDSYLLFVLFAVFKLVGLLLCCYFIRLKANVYFKLLA